MRPLWIVVVSHGILLLFAAVMAMNGLLLGYSALVVPMQVKFVNFFNLFAFLIVLFSLNLIG